MQSQFTIELEGREGPVPLGTDQRDVFALRRRGWRELGYDSAEAAMAVFAVEEENPLGSGMEALLSVTWLIWNSCTRSGLTTSDFETFAERELISISPSQETVPDPTQPVTSVGS